MDSSLRTINQGIDAIKAGSLEEGARLLRIALRDENLKGRLRSTVYMWMAETTSDVENKKQFYTDAYNADPNNELAQQRIAELLMPPMTRPVMPAPAAANNPLVMPEPPVSGYRQRSTAPQTLPNSGGASPVPAARQGSAPPVPQVSPPAALRIPAPQSGVTTLYQIVGILDGSNGPGSGFFVTHNGIIVTSRYVIDGRDSVIVELDTGRKWDAQVIRSFPELDLAFVYINQQVGDLMPFSQFPHIPDNTPLTYICHGGKTVSGQKRETARALRDHWFPTDIIVVPDAGGGPVFDEHHYVVGMLTRNHSTLASYVYGVHIAAINRCLDLYFSEIQANRSRVYCHSCGALSQAGGAGAYYCEACGTTLSHARSRPRIMTPQIALFYQENDPVICQYCGARVGSHAGKCNRCGQDVRSQSK